MPIYEYYCRDCEKQVALLTTSISQARKQEARCPNCEGRHLDRLISSVAFRTGDRDGATAARSTADSNDSATLAGAMRKSGRQARTDLGQDFKEVASRLERGESATSVEQSLRKRVGERMQPH